MICIELVVKNKLESTDTFLIDVINQRLKRTHHGDSEFEKSRWWSYQEIQGQGKPGEQLVIIWKDGKSSKSLPVVSLSHKKIK